MKILFFPVDCCPFHGKSLEERPLGGTETAVIRLAEALDALGQEVAVVTMEKEPPDTKPPYIQPNTVNQLEGIDATIIVRGMKGVFLPFSTRKKFFWTGDAWDNNHTFGIGDQRFIKAVDALFPVSQWHANTLCNSSGFPESKTYILRNGIKLSNFSGSEPRSRKRLIYTSTPNRGLKYMPPIYRELQKRHSDLELYLYGSYDRYSKQWPPIFSGDEPYEKLFEELSELPGVHIHGSINQDQLAREFMRASILAYPSDFEETSCITAMEAQAAGCAIVSSDLAAMNETVKEAGVLLPDLPSSKKYQEDFITACDRLLKDDAFFEKLSQKGKEQAQSYDWITRGKGLLDYLRSHHGLK